MQLQSRAANQTAYFDGESGEGLSIFFSQNTECIGRWRLTIKALTDQSSMVVGVIFVSPPTATNPHGLLSRLVATAIVPGVKGWEVDSFCLSDVDGNQPDESANIMLVSSKCYAGQLGASRVGERYAYAAGNGGIYQIPAGQSLLSWSAVAGLVAGSVQFGSGPIIDVPANVSVSGEPGRGLVSPDFVAFTDVAWFIEYLESA